MAKVKIVEATSLPICPHCQAELDTIERMSKGFFEQHSVYMCPYCRRLLSIGYNLWT